MHACLTLLFFNSVWLTVQMNCTRIWVQYNWGINRWNQRKEVLQIRKFPSMTKKVKWLHKPHTRSYYCFLRKQLGIWWIKSEQRNSPIIRLTIFIFFQFLPSRLSNTQPFIRWNHGSYNFKNFVFTSERGHTVDGWANVDSFWYWHAHVFYSMEFRNYSLSKT